MTGPSYTVKNIEAIAEGSDMRARLYTLAPGDVIPWLPHGGHRLVFLPGGHFAGRDACAARRRAACCRRPLPDPAEDGAPHLERWRRGLPVSAATRGRCLRLQQGPGLTEATASQRHSGAAAVRFGTVRPPLKRGGARRERENKVDDDGAFFSTTRLCQCGRLAADAVGGRLCHARTAGCGTAARPSPDLVLPSVGPL